MWHLSLLASLVIVDAAALQHTLRQSRLTSAQRPRHSAVVAQSTDLSDMLVDYLEDGERKRMGELLRTAAVIGGSALAAVVLALNQPNLATQVDQPPTQSASSTVMMPATAPSTGAAPAPMSRPAAETIASPSLLTPPPAGEALTVAGGVDLAPTKYQVGSSNSRGEWRSCKSLCRRP